MNKSNVNITVPEVADESQWRHLYQGYADFYQVDMNAQIMDNVWDWIHDKNNPFYCIVAKDKGGTLLGFMHFRAMASPLRGAMVGFLDDLFISPNARGKGVVSALYDELKQQGQQRGWPLIRWITADNNYRARAVYDGLSNKTHWVTYQLDL